MSNYKPQKGDRVRVTTEVEVIDDRVTSVATVPNGLDVRGYRALHKGIEVVIPADSCIEKIEPPVEVFKPGDVVRSKDTSATRSECRLLLHTRRSQLLRSSVASACRKCTSSIRQESERQWLAMMHLMRCEG